MSEYVVNADARSALGKGAIRRLRREDKIPAVVYGAGKDNENLELDHDGFMHQIEVDSFRTSIIKLAAGGKSQQVILREVQMHPYRPRVMHVDFQRVRATEKIHMNVPLHVVGDDVTPGVHMEAGILSLLMNEVDISCLPKDLPDFLEVDVSALALNESVHLSEVKVPEGVEITALQHEGGDHAVVAVLPPKIESVEGEEEGGEEDGIESEAADVASASED